ncbi:MAG: acyltransferase domain-containing protein [Burkholderiales bacterium]
MTDRSSGRVAFLFPGQGSQRIGMLLPVFRAFPRLAYLLDLDPRTAAAMHPPAASTPEEEAAQQAALTDTRVAQPALGLTGLAMFHALAELGVRPDMAAGHSYGELVALCAAGAMDEPTLLALSRLRGERIVEAAAEAEDPGTMAAVSADASTVAARVAGFAGVVVANENSPVQSVISGPVESIRAAVAALLDQGIAATPIPVACAFHSPIVAGACVTFAADLAKAAIRTPSLPVYANTTAAAYEGDPGAIRANLARHIGAPVRFASEIEAMYADGARVFVEAGPGRVLTGLVGRILGKRPHVAVACDKPGDTSLVPLAQALAKLESAGLTVDAARRARLETTST